MRQCSTALYPENEKTDRIAQIIAATRVRRAAESANMRFASDSVWEVRYADVVRHRAIG